MKPSTPSLTPASTNTQKAIRYSPETISQTITGTARIRAIVIAFGRFMQSTSPATPLKRLQYPCSPYVYQLHADDCQRLLKLVKSGRETKPDLGAARAHGGHI